MKPVQLRCEFQANPLGIDANNPLLGWALAGNGLQTAYQIQAATTPETLQAGAPDLWDSGRVEEVAMAVAYAGKPLASRLRCHWRVRAWGIAGRQGKSPCAWKVVRGVPWAVRGRTTVSGDGFTSGQIPSPRLGNDRHCRRGKRGLKWATSLSPRTGSMHLMRY